VYLDIVKQMPQRELRRILLALSIWALLVALPLMHLFLLFNLLFLARDSGWLLNVLCDVGGGFGLDILVVEEVIPLRLGSNLVPWGFLLVSSILVLLACRDICDITCGVELILRLNRPCILIKRLLGRSRLVVPCFLSRSRVCFHLLALAGFRSRGLDESSLVLLKGFGLLFFGLGRGPSSLASGGTLDVIRHD
jgi:hypothetical protein